MVKKQLVFLLVMTLILSITNTGIYAEETENAEVTVEKNINLALHKSVISSGENANSGNLTDGLYNTATVSGTAAKDETFTVDLERSARITDIKLWPAQTSGNIAGTKMSNIALEASLDGKEWETIQTQENISTSLTKENVFSCKLSGNEFYRYVRVRKTEAGDYEFGELEVFADVKAIEVSRGKKVTATSESSAAPTAYTLESVVDGVTTAFGWLVEADLYGEKCISIDLGKETVLDWIEMYTRRGIVAGAAYHRNWIAYGLAEGNEEFVLTPDGVGTKLFESLATSAQEANFPVNVEENDPNNHLYETLDGKTPYRHLSFRKTSLYLGLAEAGAFVIKPEVASAEIQGSKAVIVFTEKMKEDTLNDISIKIDGNDVDYEIESIEDCKAVLALDDIYYGKRADILIPDTLESARGIKIEASVLMCYFPAAVEATEPIFLNGIDEEAAPIESLSGNTSAGVRMTFKNNQPETQENVIMIAVLYNENHTIIRMNTQKAVLEPDSEAVTLTAGFNLPDNTEGCTLSVYVWKDYRFMSPWIFHKSIS